MTSGQSRTQRGTGKARTLANSPRGRASAGVGGLGGVGGGTGLTALAMHIGSDTFWGQVLLFLIPALSVISGVAIYQFNSWTDWASEKIIVRRARKTLEAQRDNPNTSEERKAEIAKKLESLDRLVEDAEIERVTEKINSRRSGKYPQPS